MQATLDTLNIRSPKRHKRARAGWEAFFPYYAGYPESFALALLTSAKLSRDAVVFDPWNGSGTTTYTASLAGLTSWGFDINPVMVIVARSRLLPPSEADSIEPLAIEIVKSTEGDQTAIDRADPLTSWFIDESAADIRRMERGIRHHLVGSLTLTPTGTNLDQISAFAATFYVALFALARELVAPFRASNPTWLKTPKQSEAKIDIPRQLIIDRFLGNIRSMARALVDRTTLLSHGQASAEIRLADTTITKLPAKSVDLVLTSPPYCTRIDYTSATRVELALLAPLAEVAPEELSSRMIGSTRVPKHELNVSQSWGRTCVAFLHALRSHRSKASNGYYYRTHLDYFDKISRSIVNVTSSLKTDGTAIVVVQDSYYKEIRNDVPTIITEIGEAHGLKLRRREDFRLRRSMSGINPRTRVYNRSPGAVEAVLCFRKE